MTSIDSSANRRRATHFQNFFAARDREPSGRLFAGHLAMSKPIASHAARALRMPSSWNPLPHQAPPARGCDSKPFALHICIYLLFISLEALDIIFFYCLFVLANFHLSMPSMWAEFEFLTATQREIEISCNGKRHRLALCCCCKPFPLVPIQSD